MSLIEVKHVSKDFQGKGNQITAVNDVNFKINSGDIFGIIGYSGAGKSTLVRLLNGLEEPTSGEIIVNNQDITKFSGKQLRNFRKKVGMIFQHFNLLWSRTVLENILLPLEINGVSKETRVKKANELIELVGLSGKENAYTSQLSGGQKQRVGIARALANDPDILLCDEATSALDPRTTDEVLNLLLDINKKLNLTIVLITHEMHVIRKICNRVVVMDNGKVVEEGNILDIFQHPQEEITRTFVTQEVAPERQEIEPIIQQYVKEQPDCKIMSLSFHGEQSKQPVVSHIIREFNLDLSVIQGNIQQTQEGSMGSLLVQISGLDSDFDKALNYLQETHIETEVFYRG